MFVVYCQIPLGIPPPSIQGYQTNLIDASTWQAREHGDVRKSSYFSEPPKLFEASWILTQEQFDLWWAWYENILGAGEQAFALDVPVLGKQGVPLTRDFERIAAQFVEPYSVNCILGSPIIYTIRARLINWGLAELDSLAGGATNRQGASETVSPPLNSSGDLTFEGYALILPQALNVTHGASAASSMIISTVLEATLSNAADAESSFEAEHIPG